MSTGNQRGGQAPQQQKRGASVGPPVEKLISVPTFDVADLEKKSPEELDALLRQLDEYGQKNKKYMEETKT